MKKTDLPVIILRGIILLPNNEIRLEFENDVSKSIIDSAELFHNNRILIISNGNSLEETVNLNELPSIGVIAKINHKIELPNGKTRVVLYGESRAKIHDYLNMNKDEILEAIVSKIEVYKIDEKEENALVAKLKRELENYINFIPYVSNSLLSVIENIKTLDKITDMVVPYLQIDRSKMIEYLSQRNAVERLKMILKEIYEEEEKYRIEKEIDNKIKQNIDENQKQYILKEKLKQIKKELGSTSLKENEINKIKKKIEKLKLNKNIKIRLEEELNRYETLQETSPENSVVRNYIEWLINIPWNTYSSDNTDLNDILIKLDENHSGLSELKERFIEYVAVNNRTKSLKSPIICLVGPPGVGKTSFVYGLAKALNREFVKISVGGLNDEAELIGHRRTYLGSNPGRIIKSLKKAKTMNPVFLIDEIDKMTKDVKGDPASVLLEILDPEQNKYFSDNYIEEEVDLSKIMFITTANDLSSIPEPLKDRLEIINLSGYTEYEKLEIAKSHLIPKICKEHNIKNKTMIDDELILYIIRNYTKESGVRELERILSKIIRKYITKLLKKRIAVNILKIDKKSIIEFLGNPVYDYQKEKIDSVGFVNGLAYTPYGGDVLQIETSYFKGNGKLKLTGSLGEVMRESAEIALSYIKSNYKKFGIDYRVFKENDIHIHVPEGAVKKDGPSAGVTLTTAIISLLSNKKVDSRVAMTGEITLRGNILKIGGLKEKSLSALRENIKYIFIPKDNEVDIEKLPKEVKENIKFIPVKTYEELYMNLVGGLYE